MEKTRTQSDIPGGQYFGSVFDGILIYGIPFHWKHRHPLSVSRLWCRDQSLVSIDSRLPDITPLPDRRCPLFGIKSGWTFTRMNYTTKNVQNPLKI